MTTPTLPSRCDYCWRRDVIVLDVGCVHEHLGTVIVCRAKHEARVRLQDGDVACTACVNDHWCVLRVVGESTRPPEPRPCEVLDKHACRPDHPDWTCP